jgi:hypothetical protein
VWKSEPRQWLKPCREEEEEEEEEEETRKERKRQAGRQAVKERMCGGERVEIMR